MKEEFPALGDDTKKFLILALSVLDKALLLLMKFFVNMTLMKGAVSDSVTMNSE